MVGTGIPALLIAMRPAVIVKRLIYLLGSEAFAHEMNARRDNWPQGMSAR